MIAQCSKVAPTVWRPKEDDTSGSIVNAFIVIATYVCVDDCLLDHKAAEAVRHPHNGSFPVLLSLKAQVIEKILRRAIDTGSRRTENSARVISIQEYSDAWLSLGQEVPKPEIAIGSTPRLGGVQWVVQRVEAMDGNDIYLSLGVIGVDRVDLSKEAFRVRHVGDGAKRYVSTSLVNRLGQPFLSLSGPKRTRRRQSGRLSPGELISLALVASRQSHF
jgi:hypothetical protein